VTVACLALGWIAAAISWAIVAAIATNDAIAQARRR